MPALDLPEEFLQFIEKEFDAILEHQWVPLFHVAPKIHALKHELLAKLKVTEKTKVEEVASQSEEPIIDEEPATEQKKRRK